MILPESLILAIYCKIKEERKLVIYKRPKGSLKYSQVAKLNLEE